MGVTPPIQLAAWLLRHGAGRSARLALADARGREANRIRHEAAVSTLVPGVYALVVNDDGHGVVMPLAARPGQPSPDLSSEYRVAIDTAMRLVRERLGSPSLPSLRLECEDLVSMVGSSIGLGAYLAFLWFYSPSSFSSRAILATGTLGANGSILPVGGLPEKLRAAAEESEDATILAPSNADPSDRITVARDLRAAEVFVFEGRTLRLEGRFRSFDDVLVEARRSPDLECIELLGAVDELSLRPIDRLRRAVALGAAYRHLGDAEAAVRCIERARRQGGSTEQRISTDERVMLELQLALSELDDEFRTDAVITRLRRLLASGVASSQVALRVQGALAQALSMAGAFAESYELRSRNLELHALSEELGRLEAGTQCYLALDAARMGDARRFDSHVARMYVVTGPNDERQLRYDASAFVRGCVALGRFDAVASFLVRPRGVERQRLPPSLARAWAGDGKLEEYPDTSTLRAWVRSLRRLGRADEARAFVASRLVESGGPTARWVSGLAVLESALDTEDIDKHVMRLASIHRRASVHHGLERAGPVGELERSIDAVWY